MITPLHDGVIILPDEVEEQVGGLILPDNLKEKPKTGTVKAVGKGIQAESTGEWIEMQVKEGDKVCFGRYVGAPINIDNQEHILLRQAEVLFTF